MTNSSQRDLAEAAFGHVQQAASEMIAAAHDALDLIDGVVSTADIGEVFETFNHLGKSVFKRPRPSTAATSDPDPAPAGRTRPARPDSTVQRISVR